MKIGLLCPLGLQFPNTHKQAIFKKGGKQSTNNRCDSKHLNHDEDLTMCIRNEDFISLFPSGKNKPNEIRYKGRDAFPRHWLSFSR